MIRVKIISLFIAVLLITNCSSSNSKETHSRPRDVRYIIELLDGDNSDLYGCSLLIKMSPWEVDDKWGGFDRRTSWRGIMLQSERSEGFSEESRSTTIQKDPKYSLIYIGKWHHVKRIDKDIRLIGYQNVDKTPARFGFSSSFGEIHHDFEARNEENEKIKEMKFKLAVIPKNTHKQDSECAIKWYDKYGYNAIAETKRVWARGIWGKLMLKHELIVTGKIIETEE